MTLAEFSRGTVTKIKELVANKYKQFNDSKIIKVINRFPDALLSLPMGIRVETPLVKEIPIKTVKKEVAVKEIETETPAKTEILVNLKVEVKTISISTKEEVDEIIPRATAIYNSMWGPGTMDPEKAKTIPIDSKRRKMLITEREMASRFTNAPECQFGLFITLPDGKRILWGLLNAIRRNCQFSASDSVHLSWRDRVPRSWNSLTANGTYRSHEPFGNTIWAPTVVVSDEKIIISEGVTMELPGGSASLLKYLAQRTSEFRVFDLITCSPAPGYNKNYEDAPKGQKPSIFEYLLWSKPPRTIPQSKEEYETKLGRIVPESEYKDNMELMQKKEKDVFSNLYPKLVCKANAECVTYFHDFLKRTFRSPIDPVGNLHYQNGAILYKLSKNGRPCDRKSRGWNVFYKYR